MLVCTLCEGEDAVFSRPYSGERLCRRCFCSSMKDRVRAAISTYHMFEYDDNIAVALSGGKDSVTLLHMLTEIEEAFPKSSVCAVSVDEGIRGYRDEALKIAQKVCKGLGVEHRIVSFKKLFGYDLDEIVALKGDAIGGLSPCSYCGVLRRRALNLIARDVDADKLALAHNLDDEAQTTLLNIIHGDTVRIVRTRPASIKVHPKLVPRVKPLCLIPEREIAFYAYLNNFEFQTFPCRYRDTALRGDMREILNRLEVKYPGTKFTIFRSSERIRSLLEKSVNPVQLKECRECGEPTPESLCKPCQLLKEIRSFDASKNEN